MQVIHKLSKNFLEKEAYQREVSDNIGFLTANRKGDFASFFNQNQSPVVENSLTTGHSRYSGWFFRNFKEVYKIVEDISLTENKKITTLKNEFWCHKRVSKTKESSVEESFFLPEKNRGLVYELSERASFNVFLDFKKIYDTSDEERHYKVEKIKNIVVIECSNKKDTAFLAIKLASPNFLIKDCWEKRNYLLDVKRNSPPHQRYVFWAIQATTKKMVLAVGDTKKQAIKEATYIFNKTYKLKKEKRENIKNFLDFSKVKNPEISMAYKASQNALRELIFEEHHQKQMSAGLPWFFEPWARDSFISMKALLGKNDDILWKICQQYFNQITEDGSLPNKATEPNMKNVDAVGWLFKRVGEGIKNKKNNEVVVWKIKKHLEKTLDKLLKTSNSKELVVACEKETWMDSIDRTGERLEVQALKLNMLKLAFNLTKDSSYKVAENSLKFKVKEKFWNGEILFDGSNDQTIRPNIFLTAYIYPELLEKKEWQTCFDNALKALWLPWGGVATIDKNSPYFHKKHTGEISLSYHSGDSWFYLNNLTAIVLQKNNPERYRAYIDKILEASSKEILLLGAVGCHSELSSSENLTSEGCYSQAWSNALFVELVQQLKTKNEK